MFRTRISGRPSTPRHRARRLAIEGLEDRQMLSTMADVVFLVDNSDSDDHTTTKWLTAIASGDTDNDGIKDTLDFSERLAAQGITDVRYGLVAFGELYRANNAIRFAHSEVVDTDNSKSVYDRLFSNGATATDHISDLDAALTHLDSVQYGGWEDGWDAIEQGEKGVRTI